VKFPGARGATFVFAIDAASLGVSELFW